MMTFEPTCRHHISPEDCPVPECSAIHKLNEGIDEMRKADFITAQLCNEEVDRLRLENKDLRAEVYALNRRIDELQARVRELDPYGRGVVRTSAEF